MTNRRAPARLSILFARRSTTAVIFRTEPTKTTRLISWDTSTDTFSDGQWVKHKVYAERSSLSPDGKYLIFFGFNFRDHSGNKVGGYTAISHPPYFSALTIRPQSGTWGGGGLFLDERHIWIRHQSPDTEPEHQLGLPAGLRAVYAPKRGPVPDDPADRSWLQRPDTFYYADGSDAKIDPQDLAALDQYTQYGEWGARLVPPLPEWCVTRKGCLYRRDETGSETLLRDFNDMEYAPVIAPYASITTAGIRPATIEDQSTIEAFLDARLPSVMFPRSNLADYGLFGDAPYASRYWIDQTNRKIDGLVALSQNGVVQPCLPAGGVAAAAKVLQGQTVSALIGPKDQVRALLPTLGLAGAPRSMDSDEPHFLLDLDALIVPEGTTHLIPMRDAPLATLQRWFAAYEAETLNTPAEQARIRGEAALSRILARNAGVVLMRGATPVAMTSFNAERPSIVQVGSVYTPPEYRGHAHARRAIALHLQEARCAGVGQATLFSANETASKTYRALGFRQIGDWSVVLFKGTQVINVQGTP